MSDYRRAGAEVEFVPFDKVVVADLPVPGAASRAVVILARVAVPDLGHGKAAIL
jgi:hypothetical protein